MNKTMRKCIALFSLITLLVSVALVPIEVEAASEFYGDYTDVSYIYDYGYCTGMQGLAVGSQMLYTVKINESDQLAVIKMTDKDSGETTTLYNSDEGSYYFSYLDHANDMDVWGIDGYSNIFVATTRLDSYGIVRLQREGSSLTRVANYKLVCDGETICATAMGVMGVSNGMINFITKWGQDVYTGSVSTSVTSGTIEMTHLCTISKESVYIKGQYLDLSHYINQGMGYYDNTLYVPITGDDYNLEQSVIMVFNLEDVIEGSTIYPSEELVFRVTSSYYSALFEIESCGISSDGRLYFNQNRRVTTSDYNHDGVSYFDTYTYSKLTEPADYHYYTVRYDANGGTGSMANTTVPYGVATALRRNSFTRAGYQFDGWTAYRTTNAQWYYTNGSSTGWYSEGSQPSGYTKAIYDDGQRVSATSSVYGDVVIMYAQWENAGSYQVTFRNDDGTVLKSGQVTAGTVPTAPSSTPTKASDGVYRYTFAGWSPSITAVTGDTTYTATYTATLLPVTPSEPAAYPAGTIAPYLDRVNSAAELQEGVPYVISDYKDSWLHYVLTAQTAQKVSGSLVHQGLLLDGLPSVNETNLWYIKGGRLVYGSANSNNYLLISCAEDMTGTVKLGSYDYSKAATVTHNSGDDFIIGGTGAYLNRHGGTSTDFVATAYPMVGGSYWHLDRLVRDQVAGITLSGSGSSVSVGDTLQLRPAVNISGIATNTYVINWKTSNSSVATVSSNGTVNALSGGQATITATLTSADGHELLVPISATYTVQVDATVNHNYKAFVIEPTCTTGGYTTYRCTICGDTYQGDITPAAGHSYTSVVTRPTCIEQGYTTYSCSICGTNYRGDYVNATGHSYNSVVTKPTCTAQGYTTYTCRSCGSSYKDNYTTPKGHSYSTSTVAATCTTAGSVTKTCSGCGDRQVTTIPATGHKYTNGKCSVCGAADPNYSAGVTKPTLTLKSPTLEFKDMISITAFYTAENVKDVVEMGMITYDEKVTTVSVTTADFVIPGATYVESTGRYYSSSQGIAAKYLADTVYLAIYAKLSDGSYAYSKLAPYSAITYANSQLKNSTDVKLKQLVVAMLNYGAKAQLHFNHNTGSLATAALTADQLALPAAYNSGMVSSVPSAPANKQGIFANNQGFAKRTPSISFEGAFCINYFFTPKYAPDSGITMYYWTAEDYNAASVLTTSNATGKIKLEGSGTGQYQGDIEGIAAKALSEAVYVACAYKSGGKVWTSGVLGYSIGAYCSGQSTKAGTIADLAKATAVYGYHAKQYFG